MRLDTAWLRWSMDSARSWRDIENLVPQTGIDMIDADNRQLLEFSVALNLLAQETAHGFSPQLLLQQRTILSSLMALLQNHFSREEVLMSSLSAVGYTEHKADHDKILAELQNKTADFMGGHVSVSAGLRRIIFTRIVDHITKVDKEAFAVVNLETYFSSVSNWQQARIILRSTGVDLIDSEHRAIVQLILGAVNEMYIPRGKFPELLDELYTAMAIHFADEEQFISDYMIPHLQIQVKSHEEFLSSLDAIRRAVMQNGVSRGMYSQISRTLIQWITIHVNQEDYATFRVGDWRVHAFETLPSGKIFPLLRRTGIKMVDNQHQTFIAKAVAFCDELDVLDFSDKEASREALRDFDDLIHYALTHFADEEALFNEDQRSASPRHFIEHNTLSESLTSYRDRFAEGLISSSQAVRNVILGWWLTHTNGTDIDTFGSVAFDTDLLEAPRD